MNPIALYFVIWGIASGLAVLALIFCKNPDKRPEWELHMLKGRR